MPTPLVSNIKYHDYQFEFPTSVGKWRWTTRLDVSQANPVYSVMNVVSPYGLLRDSIPIPGDIVGAMSASIDELKSNFAPHILLGPPSSLIFSVNEGQGFATGQPVLVTNDGVYGSLLGLNLTASAPYLRLNPVAVGNLALNESGQFQVEVDSTGLLAVGSPYNATVSLQDGTASNNPVTLPVTINVLPKATIGASLPSLTFSVTKPLSGPFSSVPTQQFQVLNIGPSGSELDFDLNKLFGTSDWLVSFLPVSGSLGSGQNQPITVQVVIPDGMSVGTFTETLRISGYSSNSYLDVQIQLVISEGEMMSKRTSQGPIDLNTPAPNGQPIGNDSVQKYVASTRPLADFDLGGIEVQGSTGMDAFFARDASMITPPGSKTRVASLRQLDGFTRISSDTLIHKSDRDLWAIKREANGTMVIERMFDDNGKPLKG